MYTFKKRYVIYRVVDGELEFVHCCVGKVSWTKNPCDRTFETFADAEEYLNAEVRRHDKSNLIDIGKLITGVIPVDGEDNDY